MSEDLEVTSFQPKVSKSLNAFERRFLGVAPSLVPLATTNQSQRMSPASLTSFGRNDCEKLRSKTFVFKYFLYKYFGGVTLILEHRRKSA